MTKSAYKVQNINKNNNLLALTNEEHHKHKRAF